MNDLAPIIQWLKVSFDKSSLSGWVLCAMVAIALWKGSPAIIDAFTKRMDLERQRAKEEREETRAEMARLHQLHLDCENARRIDREEADRRIGTLYDQVDELRRQLAGAMEKIAGLSAAKAQQQVSTANLLSSALPDNEGVRLAELAERASAAMKRAGK